MLQCRDITKYIGSFALKDVSFALEPGYILGVIGRNGSGKSTLLRVLLGSYLLYDPYDKEALHTMQRENLKRSGGDVWIEDCSLRAQETVYKTKLAYILSESPFDLRFTALEAGMLYGQYYEDFSMKKYGSFLQEYAIPKYAVIGKLSKGQQIKQQLAFAKSYPATLYLLDEPAANLDVEFRSAFYQELRDIMASGDKYMILVSHLVEELEQLCDYVLWLQCNDRETVSKPFYYGSMEELKDSFSLLALSEKELEPYQQWIVGGRCNAVHQEYLLNKAQKELPDALRPYSRQAFLKEIMYYVDEGEGKMEREGK